LGLEGQLADTIKTHREALETATNSNQGLMEDKLGMNDYQKFLIGPGGGGGSEVP
jgi:hypothetical protein